MEAAMYRSEETSLNLNDGMFERLAQVAQNICPGASRSTD
jgi:hypothetical protein